jgi:hypothetical protein
MNLQRRALVAAVALLALAVQGFNPTPAQAEAQTVCSGPQVEVLARSAVTGEMANIQLKWRDGSAILPYLYEQQTYVPYSRLVPELGGQVRFDSESSYAIFGYQGRVARVKVLHDRPQTLETIDPKTAKVHRQHLRMFTCRGRLFGPVRPILEALGFDPQEWIKVPTFTSTKRVVLIDGGAIRTPGDVVEPACLEEKDLTWKDWLFSPIRSFREQKKSVDCDR